MDLAKCKQVTCPSRCSTPGLRYRSETNLHPLMSLALFQSRTNTICTLSSRRTPPRIVTARPGPEGPFNTAQTRIRAQPGRFPRTFQKPPDPKGPFDNLPERFQLPQKPLTLKHTSGPRRTLQHTVKHATDFHGCHPRTIHEPPDPEGSGRTIQERFRTSREPFSEVQNRIQTPKSPSTDHPNASKPSRNSSTDARINDTPRRTYHQLEHPPSSAEPFTEP
jgi:hypothetical protein